MATKLKYLRDKFGEIFYPFVHARGILIDGDKSLQEELSENKRELQSGVSSVASSVDRLETAIQNLPDGQAVSAEVARLSAIGFFETNEDGIAFVDSNLNIGVLIDNDGIHAKNLLEYEIVNN